MYLTTRMYEDYSSSSIASDQGCCERYSFGHKISSAFHEMPESVEQNIPRLLTAKNCPGFLELATRIGIIVPLGSGRPFEINFHSLSSSDLLYINDSVSCPTECACQGPKDADTITV